MIHPTSGSEMIANANAGGELSRIENVSNVEDSNPTEGFDDISNPTNLKTLEKISNKVDGNGLTMKNIVNSIDLINTANDLVENGGTSASISKMEKDLSDDLQRSVAPDKSESLMKQINDSLSVYKNASSVDPSDNFTQKIQEDKNVYIKAETPSVPVDTKPVVLDEAVKIDKSEKAEVVAKETENSGLKNLAELATQKVEEKIKMAFASKGDDGKSGGLGDKIKDMTESMKSNPSNAISMHQNISAPEVLATLT
mgnify:CR=1 FL=1